MREGTCGALEACWASCNDLADAMWLSPHQAICQVDHDCRSSHAVHQLDVLKGRLAAITWMPSTTTMSGTVQADCSQDCQQIRQKPYARYPCESGRQGMLARVIDTTHGHC